VDRSATSICDLLKTRAKDHPDRRAYTFLVDSESNEHVIRYVDLHIQACAVARTLTDLTTRGKTALLLYADGPEFIPGFLGCLYAGTIAAPTFPPHAARLRRTLPRLVAIARDAEASVILTTKAILGLREAIVQHAPELGSLPWIATDAVEDASDFEPVEPASGDLAYLQYTSGSTGSPKGVRVTHGNLMHNEAMIQEAFGTRPGLSGVGWLPLFHDMGLIGNLLHTLYIGSSIVLMSPLAFLQRPIRWLEAISRYRATATGGPNFAYDLCVQRTTEAQRASLDLSSLETAFCGAEPIQHGVLERFAEAFEPAGFRRDAFLPCYGLAEATLLVSGGSGSPSQLATDLDAAALQRGRVAVPAEEGAGVRRLVSCGRVPSGHRVEIVDPETSKRCARDRVGEVWVASPSVADGYWKRPEESEATFQARLRGEETPFLRTGDLGFLRDGELYIAGRLKDLIIVRGRNHHPQDIEQSVQAAHRDLRPGCGVAFSVSREDTEELVIVQEVRKNELEDPDSVFAAMRAAVARDHELATHAIALVAPRSVPKTSSGKLQRRACRQAFLDDDLELVAAWAATGSEHDPGVAIELTRLDLEGLPGGVARGRLFEWFLRATVAQMVGLEENEVHSDVPLADLGLDSLTAVELRDRLESVIEIEIPARIFFSPAPLRVLSARLLAEAGLGDGSTDEPLGLDSEGVDSQDTRESMLRDIVLEPSLRREPAPWHEPHTVVLTGATGFVGAFLLDALLRASDRGRVLCMVRAATVEEADGRLRANLARYGLSPPGVEERVVPLVADLSAPRLGLDAERWSELAEQVDTIYHNAAEMNWLAHYSTLRRTNVEGTRQILWLAAEGRPKTIHYVSSVGVAGRGAALVEEGTDREQFLGKHGNGYEQSKWVAEGLVEQAGRRGVAIAIYRPGLVVGDSRSGACAAGDFMNSVLRACIELGSCPQLPAAIDLSPVDYVTRGLVALSREASCVGQVFHLVHPEPVSVDALRDLFEACGHRMAIESYETWHARAVAAAGRPGFALGTYLEILPSPERASRWFRLPRYGCDRTLDSLAATSVAAPPIDIDYLGRTLAYQDRLGLLRRPSPDPSRDAL
jgi:thioester reductase-like protein